MAFSVERLTNRADCDALLELAANEQKVLEHRKVGFEIQKSNYQKSSIDVENELKMVAAQLNALSVIIPALAEGEKKEEEITRQMKFEVRERQLRAQREDFGVLALCEKELELDRINKELESLAAFKAAVEARKQELPA